ncbi:hypothetical protein AB2S20_25535 [Escherichia coli]
MTLTEKTGHLAWCALVALALARQEQGELSPALLQIVGGDKLIIPFC